jgi:hypothetical protein
MAQFAIAEDEVERTCMQKPAARHQFLSATAAPGDGMGAATLARSGREYNVNSAMKIIRSGFQACYDIMPD